MRKNFKWLLALVAMVASVNLMWAVSPIDSGTSQFTEVSGDLDNNISYSTEKAGGTNAPVINSGNIRLYRNNKNSAALGSTLTLTPKNGATITSVTFTLSSSLGYSYSVDGGTAKTGNSSSIAISGISATKSVVLQNNSSSQMDVTRIQVTYTGGAVAKTLESIAISGNPTKTEYDAGDEFDPAGLVVTGTYDDKSTAEITKGIEWAITPSGALTAGTTSVSVTATVDKITSDAYQVNGLTVNAIEGDRLTLASTGVSSSGYTAWNDKVGSQGIAKYAGQSSNGNSSIQMRNQSPSGIVSTTSAGIIKKVKVDWNSNTSSTGNRSIDIYGSNTAYTGSGDIYDTEKQGTKLGSIVCGTSTELVVEGDYEYVGVRAIGGALYLNSITFVWSAPTPSTVTLDSLIIKGTASKMEYEVGEAFDPAGLEVWGIYTKTVKHDSTSQITKGITWTLDPETFAEASNNASVTLSASYKDKTTADTTITGINVMAALPKIDNWNTLFKTSYNGTISGLQGQNDLVLEGTTDFGVTVKVENHAAKNGYIKDQDLRLYTNNSGDYTFTVTAPTGKVFKQIVVTKAEKDIAVKEKDEKGAISIGTSGAMTWTGKANSLVFIPTATTGFGTMTFVIAESAPAAATPTITPSTEAEVYWEPITVTLATTTEGAAIYYTTNGDAPTAASTLYEAPFQVSATTTVKAIAVKEGLDNSEVASKIFNFGKVYDNIAACFADETLQNGDVVKISNVSAVITSFAKSGKTVYFEGGSFYVNAICPQTYAIGGTLSGSNLQFTYMNYDPKQLRPASWETLTYTAPGEPTGVNNVKANAKATKAIVNGQIVIVRDNKTYNVLGF